MRNALLLLLYLVSLKGVTCAGVFSKPVVSARPGYNNGVLQRHFAPAISSMPICTGKLHQRHFLPPVYACFMEPENEFKKKAFAEKTIRSNWVWQIPQKYRKDNPERETYFKTWEDTAKKIEYAGKNAPDESYAAPWAKWSSQDLVAKAKELQEIAKLNAMGSVALDDGEKDFIRERGVAETWKEISTAWRVATKSLEDAEKAEGWTAAQAQTLVAATEKVADLASVAQIEKIAEAFTKAKDEWEVATNKLEKAGKVGKVSSLASQTLQVKATPEMALLSFFTFTAAVAVLHFYRHALTINDEPLLG